MLKLDAYYKIDPQYKPFKGGGPSDNWDGDVEFIHGKLSVGECGQSFSNFYCFYVPYKKLFTKHMGR